MGLKALDYEINWFMGYLWLPWLALWADVIDKKSVKIALSIYDPQLRPLVLIMGFQAFRL